MARKAAKKGNGLPVDPFECAAGVGMQQAMLGWNIMYFHDMIEKDPKFRKKILKETTAMYKHLVEIMEKDLAEDSDRA